MTEGRSVGLQSDSTVHVKQQGREDAVRAG